MSPAEPSKRALAEPSRRLDAVPAYMFAELERRVAEKREEGIDVISLGIGDPDRPTYPHVVAAMQAAVADPANQHYPSNRGRAELRGRSRTSTQIASGSRSTSRPRSSRRSGPRSASTTSASRSSTPATSRSPLTRATPCTRAGRRSPGRARCCCALRPELGFIPDLDAIASDDLARARLLFVNYPNNPTGAVVPDGFFERLVDLARAHEVLIVHDNAYSETTYDGYVAPSFLATPGAKEVGVEVFSLSKGFNMTGWRCAAILGNPEAIESYWRLKTNVDSGLFEAVQLAGAAALAGPREPIEEMNAIYARRRDLVVGALREIGVRVDAPKGTIYVWAPVPEGHTSQSFAELVLEEAAVVVSPGSMYGPSGEGFFRISLTTPDDRISEAVSRMREHLA